MLKFPSHKASMYITHNGHKGYYKSIPEYLREQFDDLDSWISDKDRQKSVDTDELWELQWYPETPVGSYVLYGSSLKLLLEHAKKYE